MKKVFLLVTAIIAANLAWAQWESDVRLTNDPGVSNTSYNNAWCIAASGDTVHVVWFDDRDLNQEIYYKRSTDGGLSWGPDIRLTNAADWSYSPSIVVSGSTVHVVWSDFRNSSVILEIYYKRSEDGGSTWGADTRLTEANSYAEFPSMAISGSVLHVVWTDYRDQPGDYDIYYKRSTDGGLNWGPDLRLSDDPAYSGFPSVAASGSVVHVLWEDQKDGNGEIYYKRSTDEGVTWGPEVRLTNNPFDSWDPCVSLNNSEVHVVWMDKRDGGAYEIYYKRSTDGGLTWGSDTRLTNATGDSKYPNIIVSDSIVHVVWQDKRDVNQEIYYKESTDGGSTWEEDVRLTNATYASQNASVAVSGSAVHVVWYDMRNMNEEIYYKRNPTGNIIVGMDNMLLGKSEQPFTIYPNPASSRIHLQFNDYSNEESRFTIRNILGETIITRPIRKGEAVIDISMLPNGLYFVEIAPPDKQAESRKLIIQN